MQFQVNGKDSTVSEDLLDSFRRTQEILESDLARQLKMMTV